MFGARRHRQRLEADLAEIKDSINLLRKGNRLTMAALDDLITALNDNTNAVGTRLDKLTAEIAAAGAAPTPAQLAELQAVADHLKALGADPANPVPAAPPPSSPTS
jgi:hypothetical protein